MNASPKRLEAQAPVFGTLSIVVPLVGVSLAAALAFLFPRQGDEAFMYPALGFMLTVVALTCGVFFAFRASKRQERYPALFWVGLFINLLPLVAYVTYVLVW